MDHAAVCRAFCKSDVQRIPFLQRRRIGHDRAPCALCRDRIAAAQHAQRTHRVERRDSLREAQSRAVVRLLERGEAPLAESMKLFEEGTKLSAALGKLLDKAEQKVTVVQENLQGEVTERPFDAEEAAK